MPTLHLQHARATCDIHIGCGRLRDVGALVRETLPHDRALVAVDAKIADTHGRAVVESLHEAGYESISIALDADEKRKSLETVRAMYHRMLQARLERGSPVIAVGGGVVGDTAGFAAATYLRGVPFVQVPTTLLAMVDASIGGKTGVNIPLPGSDDREPALGKNLIGAFWQPRFVLADPEVLATLDARDYRCGLAECIKHGLIADASHVNELRAAADALLSRDLPALEHLVCRSAAIKVSTVEADEREADRRALLNLGHTFAHAIEPIASLDLRHGEAVAIGLIAAMHVSVATGRATPADAALLREVIETFRLPTAIAHAVAVDELVTAMHYDKKVRAGRLRLVLPIGIGHAEVVDDVDMQVVTEAWQAVGAR